MGYERQMTRRQLLRASGQATILATAGALFATPRVAAAEPFALRTTWEQQAIPLLADPLLSPPLAAESPFNAVESRWRATIPAGATLDLGVRTSANGAEWTDWSHLHEDTHARDLNESEIFGDLLMVAPSQYAQYRLAARAGAGGELPTLHAFALSGVNTLNASALRTTHTQAVGGVAILPRAAWGADEKLRFGKDGKESWPTEYRAIQKVIVHHTVTRDPETDPKATIRAIYQYHAVSRGWGDIGYNFLIDPQGNIYEGRSGGDRVVGGHALQYNWGSIGIAILGTYMDHSLSDAARTSLLALIRAKAGDLDPVGKGFYIDREGVLNINGHRGVLNTSCPGDGFYPQMNNIRRELKGLPIWTGDPKTDPIAANPPDVAPASSPDGKVDATLVDVVWDDTDIYSRDLLRATITLKNTGSTAILPQDPPPDFVYTEGDSYAKRGFRGTKGSVRIALGPELVASSDPPYRWGVGKTLAPGATTTFSVAVKMTTVQKARYVATATQDGGGPLDHDEAVQVSVTANPTDPAQAATGAGTKFFAETKHNVGTDFLAYWNANGALAQFGYPLSEVFSDLNPDDGKPYKVQYFERARFEYHPEKAGTPYVVELGRLGVLLAKGREAEKPFVKVAKIEDTAERRFFPEVGHTLGGAFKTYWEGHGGAAIFGFPLSEPFEEKSTTDGKTYLVQYFERNRFEYRPESKGTPQEIQLGLLGSETIRRRGWIG